jgi:ATP-dependent helicase HepA
VIPEARSVFAQELAEPLRLEVERARMQLESLSMGDAASKAEAEMLERYCVLIEGWDIVVDGIGFLAVNVRA